MRYSRTALLTVAAAFLLGSQVLAAPRVTAVHLPTSPPAGAAAGAAPNALSSVSRPAAARRLWTAPVSPIEVVEPFRPPAHDWLPGHRGIDLRTHPGDPIHAAGTGVVAFARTLAGRGVVVIDHGDLRTTYEPVVMEVGVGQRVRAGDRIGTVGTGVGHCGSGRCLHLGLRRGSEYLDPALILWTPRARLVPW